MLLTEEIKQKFKIPENSEFDGTHLISTNVKEFQIKKIQHSISLFGIDDIAGKTLKKIAKIVNEPLDIFDPKVINYSVLEPIIGQDKATKFIEGINQFKKEGIPLEKIIRSVSYDIDNLGKRTSSQFAKYLSGISYDFRGLEKKVINQLKSKENEILESKQLLENLGCKILLPKEIIQSDDTNIITFVLTGSPREFGFKTKSEFIKNLPENCQEVGKLSSETNYLITNDVNSSSSKTKTAKKLNIKIVTYGEFINLHTTN